MNENVKEIETILLSNIINFKSHFLIKYVTLSDEERYFIKKKKDFYRVTQYDVYNYKDINENIDLFEIKTNKKLLDFFYYTEDNNEIMTDEIIESSLYIEDDIPVYEDKSKIFTKSITWFEHYDFLLHEDIYKYIHMYTFCNDIKNIYVQPTGYIDMKVFDKFKLKLKYKKKNDNHNNNKQLIVITRSYSEIFI